MDDREAYFVSLRSKKNSDAGIMNSSITFDIIIATPNKYPAADETALPPLNPANIG